MMKKLIGFIILLILNTVNAGVSTKENFFSDIIMDYKNTYTLDKSEQYLAFIGTGAAFANTQLDTNIRDWYQDHMKNNKITKIYNIINDIHNYQAVIAGTTILSVAYFMPDDDFFWELTSNTVRGLLIALPQQYIMTEVIEGKRPTDGSSWSLNPMTNESATVSGHALYSIPFFTAAKLSENTFLKAFFNVLAFLPGLARINDDKHYFSQVLIGTGFGYLATNSVAETNRQRAGEDQESISILPEILPEGGYQLTMQMKL